MGLDALEQFHRWKYPERILGLCYLVAVRRPGCLAFDMEGILGRYPQAAGKVELLLMPVLEISGTDLRRRAAAGESLRYQVPDAVARYIEEHRLYQYDV